LPESRSRERAEQAVDLRQVTGINLLIPCHGFIVAAVPTAKTEQPGMKKAISGVLSVPSEWQPAWVGAAATN
jgi:hypothetical protein